MRFEKEMRKVAYDLETKKGYNILQCSYTVAGIQQTATEIEALERAHYRKIDISDGIYVLNLQGYIGESVRKEIDYARRKGKEIIYHCD